MKRIISAFMAIVLVLSALVVTPQTAQAATMSISETSRTIVVKEQFRLYMKYTTAKVTWSAKDKSVAKVSGSGIVTGVKAGTTTVTAKVGKKTFQCKVTVIPAMSKELTALAGRFSSHYDPDYYVNADKISIQSISRGSYVFDRESWNISTFDYKICFTGYSSEGTEQHWNMYYNSTRDCVEEMMENSGPLEKTEETEHSFSESDVQKVEQRARLIASGKYDPDADDGKIKMNNTDLTLCVGDTYNLKVKNTTKKVKWGSGKTSVATVSNGKVTAKKTGTAKIKATVDGVTVYATVYVIKSYTKNMRSIISGLATVKHGFEYPDEMTVTEIQLGAFKRNNTVNISEGIHVDDFTEFFAIFTVTGKDSKGQPSEEKMGISYTTSGNWIVSHPINMEYLIAEGEVTYCTEQELAEMNKLLENGKGRLLIKKN